MLSKFTGLFKKNKVTLSSDQHQDKDSLYYLIGGDIVVKALCKQFYVQMRSNAEAKHLLDIHPQPMDRAEERLYMFLSGWLGGPQLYTDKFGHPMLRMRHMHFNVDAASVEQWLMCMSRALDMEVEQISHRRIIMKKLTPLAQHMQNC
ncbi:group II truncated hemoglobin [Paraferrimonas sp. SM1919]|uniref:group II truncated hemoglobin n=1 Tax=Paraferrimonas sp. SM1919 TaxID=2662263 RepID=UPI0013D1AF3A|nr:group II truncated hemoglobin [Paraferrimonas sp. SM1919]